MGSLVPLSSSLLAGSAVYKFCCLPVNIVALHELKMFCQFYPPKKPLKSITFQSLPIEKPRHGICVSQELVGEGYRFYRWGVVAFSFFKSA